MPWTPLLRLFLAQLYRIRYIADWCIEPDIEHFSFSTLNRYRNTPVEVTGHSTGLQIHIQPRLALAIDIGAPLLVVFQNPLLQPLLIFVQGQIPVLGRLQNGC